MRILLTLEGHKEKGVYNCFFIQNKDQNDKILLSFTEKEMVCWYIDNIYEHWIKLYSIDKKIDPVTGYNNQLTGLYFDENLRVWDEKLLYELSDNRHELIKHYEEDFYKRFPD